MNILNFKFFFLIKLLFLAYSINIYPQSVELLRAQQDSLLKEIDDFSSLLKSKRETRENTLKQFNNTQSEISIRENVLSTLSDEIILIDQNLENFQLEINGLESEINVLKEEYALLILDSYKRRNALNELIYFISASDFSSAYRRYRVLKEYTRYRQGQGQKLIEKQNRYVSLVEDILMQREQKEQHLKLIESEYVSLNRAKNEYHSLMGKLEKEESWLKQQIKIKEESAKKLENSILDFLQTAGIGITDYDFENFKGKLKWPVKRGTIVSEFGQHPHPVLKNVFVNNNGIDIQSFDDNKVFSVHNGEVSRVVVIPGYNNAVIIRHGKYLTVYANLINVYVSAGKKIQVGSLIGEIYSDTSDSETVLHFEIWHEKSKLDPSNWLLP